MSIAYRIPVQQSILAVDFLPSCIREKCRGLLAIVADQLFSFAYKTYRYVAQIHYNNRRNLITSTQRKT